MKKNHVFLVTLLISVLSFGQEFLVENFDYGTTPNDLHSVGSDWINITGGDFAPFVGYLATSLTMPDYESIAKGGSANLNIASQPGQFGQDLHRQLDPLFETIYLSALVNVAFVRTGGSDYFMHFNSGEYLGTDENFDPVFNNVNDRARVFVRDNGSGGINFGILSSGETADVSWDPNVYDKATTYLIVASYDTASGTSKLYVLTAPIVNEPAQANASHQFPGVVEINAFSLRQKAYGPSATVDGIKVVGSW
ncbi:hypothetical protein [Thalassobellus suaedae]|uniref:Uncharacterized protein n=1 Tax=Thalassobellus suaedae TaxID=3074124 RepID=A0ABY9XQD2_9FLAO|nr:hypothetical protein RHP51_13290 [Flavobacteriaceae bacterium HL-DH14]